MTLHFFGDVRDERIEEGAKALSRLYGHSDDDTYIVNGHFIPLWTIYIAEALKIITLQMERGA